mgnify:CR=1 FL=1
MRFNLSKGAFLVKIFFGKEEDLSKRSTTIQLSSVDTPKEAIYSRTCKVREDDEFSKPLGRYYAVLKLFRHDDSVALKVLSDKHNKNYANLFHKKQLGTLTDAEAMLLSEAKQYRFFTGEDRKQIFDYFCKEYNRTYCMNAVFNLYSRKLRKADKSIVILDNKTQTIEGAYTPSVMNAKTVVQGGTAIAGDGPELRRQTKTKKQKVTV